MASSSASQYFEIPKYFLFSEKGIYSGSASEKDFNYKVVPVCPKEGDKCLKAFVWAGQMCVDKSENATVKEFAFSEDGYKEMLAWLESEYLSREDALSVPQQQQAFARKLCEDYVSLEDYFEKTQEADK